MTTRDIIAGLDVEGTEIDSTEGMLFEGHRGVEAAVELYRAGLVTHDEMVMLLQWTNPDDDPKEVIGLAAGEFQISKKRMNDQGIDTTGVAEIMKGHTEWWKDAFGFASKLYQVSGFGAGSALAWRGGAWAADWIGEVAEEAEATNKRRDDLRKSLESDEFREQVIDAGYMTESEVRGLTDRLRTGLDITEEGVDEVAAELAEFIDILPSDVQGVVRMVTDLEVGPEFADMTPAEVRAYKMEYGGPAVGAYAGTYGQPGVPDEGAGIEGARPGSFAAYLNETGLRGPEDAGYLPVDIAAPTPGLTSPLLGDAPGEAFYDKSTNKMYSALELQRIYEGQQMVASGMKPDAAYDIRDDATIGGGGRIGEAFAEGELEPNLNDPRVRGAYGTYQGGYLSTMPDYLKETIQVPSWTPSQPWEKPAYDWQAGSALVWLNGLSAGEKRRWQESLKARGLYNVRDAQGATYFDSSNQDFMLAQLTQEVLSVSRGKQINPWSAIPVLGTAIQDDAAQKRALLAHTQALANALKPVKQPFSIPRSLRSIPDVKEITQEVTDKFRIRVGRDPTMGERERLAEQLTGYHKQRQRESIDLAYSEWEGSNEIMDGANLEEVIANPSLMVQFDMENDWANEINLNKRRETNSDSFGRMASASGFGTYGTTITSGNNVVGR